MNSITITDIKDSIRVPNLIKDEFIRTGTFLTQSNGDFIMYSGGFASVFPVIVNDEKWAFRCWHSELSNTQKRMDILSDNFKNHQLPYFCDFIYVENGIIVNGKTYPTTRMKWVEGDNLKVYLENNINHPDRLKKLANEFLQMCNQLHTYQYAHGDLQHGNILITPEGNIRLVDYDSMYCPEINNMLDYIHGLIDYQHPNRKENKYASEKLDYFSELIIYTSILALAEKPDLFEKYKVKDTESLLFSANDYKNIKESSIYRDISLIGEDFTFLLNLLYEYLSTPNINNLKPFVSLYTELPNIILFNSTEKCILANQEVHIQYNIENVTSACINNLQLDVEQHEIILKLEKTSDIILYTKNFFGETKYLLHIEVYNPPILKEFRFTKNKIKHGSKTTIKWFVENSFNQKIYDGNEYIEIPPQGEMEISPSKSTICQLQIVGLDQKTIIRKEIEINVFKEVNILFFDSEYSSIVESLSTELSWNVENATSIELRDTRTGNIITSSSNKMKVFPKATTTYILYAKNDLFTKQEEITILVDSLPKIPPLPSIDIDFDILSMKEIERTLYSIKKDSELELEKIFFQRNNISILQNVQKIIRNIWTNYFIF